MVVHDERRHAATTAAWSSATGPSTSAGPATAWASTSAACPPPPAHTHPLQVSSLRITVAGRTVVARARINHRAVARLVLSRGQQLARRAALVGSGAERDPRAGAASASSDAGGPSCASASCASSATSASASVPHVRWAALVSLAAGVVVALSVAQFAPGQAIERVRVDRPSAAFPKADLIVGSPDEYARVAFNGTSGLDRPLYWRPDYPEGRNNATIDWEVGFDERPLATERIALANLTRTGPRTARGDLDRARRRAPRGRDDSGFFVLQVERRSAPSELVVAFPVAPKLHVFVRFLLLRPESDAYVVKGSMLASSWNRGQALLAMSRTRLEGNLPPALVTARPRRRESSGLRRRLPPSCSRRTPRCWSGAGSGWRRISSVKTNRLGGYTFR